MHMNNYPFIVFHRWNVRVTPSSDTGYRMACYRSHTPRVCKSLTCDADEGSFLNRKLVNIIIVCIIIILFYMFNFVSWDVRGLVHDHKRELLSEDCVRYKIDIACIQETNVQNLKKSYSVANINL